MSSQPTLRDVAIEAETSISMASRILSGRRPIVDEHHRRVHAAVTSLGYRPNLVARSLREQATGTIGVVVPDICNPFFPTLLKALEAEAAYHDRFLLVVDSGDDSVNEARCLRRLLDKQVDGIILIPTGLDQGARAISDVAKLVPVVQLDRVVDGTRTHVVGTDDLRGVGLLVDHLCDNGAETIAFVSSEPDTSTGRERLEGFLAGSTRRGVRTTQHLGSYTTAFGRHAVDQILELGGGSEYPDAILCGADVIAFGVLSRLRDHAISVPEDVLVCGYDGTDMAELVNPSLTTLHQPIQEIAHSAVQLVSQQNRPRRILFEPELQIRHSTQPELAQ